MPRPRPVESGRSKGESGFTLVEVLVALIVTSMILSIVMNAALQAKSRAIAALEKQEAVTLARALIAERAVTPFEAGTRSGEEGALRWRTDETSLALAPGGLLVLSEIHVSVKSATGASLASLRLRRMKGPPLT